MFKISGTLKVINDTVSVTEKFSKREFVITDNQSMYPQDVLFQMTQDKCSLLDSCVVGSIVDVSFNLRGREWMNPQGEVKYFNTLDSWRIETVNVQQNMPPVAAEQPNPASSATSAADDDDLPF